MDTFLRPLDNIELNWDITRLGSLILLGLIVQVSADFKNQQYGDQAFTRVGSDTSVADGTIIVHPDQRLEHESTVESWEIYAANHSGSAVRLTIWRPKSTSGTNKVYRLAGASLWQTPSPGKITYTLSTNEKISVEKDDVIGYQWRHANMLHYEPMSCSDTQFYYRYYSSHVEFAHNTDYTFEMKPNNAGACRKVSLLVNVKAIVCKEIYSSTLLESISPLGAPQQYQANAHECWILKLMSSASSHDFIRLKFGQGNFESQSTCTKDYVTIRNGLLSTSPEMLKWCNGNRPEVLDSPGSTVFVSFVSDSANQGTGFSLFHQQASDASVCTALTASTNNQTFSSHPTYPSSNYSSYALFCWVITAPAGKTILITLEDMELQNSAGCISDHLSIRNGAYRDSTEIGRYCGTTKPSTITSSGNTVHILFQSDVTQTFRGFKIRYIVYTTTNDGCTAYSNIAVGAAEGTITSANYPSEYAGNTDKCWRLETASPNNVRLMVESSVLESSSDCSKDYLEVKDGPGSSSQSLMKWCGSLNPGTLTSSGNNLYVRFVSDGSNQEKGFQIKFIAINSMTCLASVAGSAEFHISSLNYPSDYTANGEQCWVVSTSNARIKVTIKSFTLESSTNCNSDFVELRDGSTSSSLLLDRMCGTVSSGEYTTSGNKLYVYFHSNRGNHYKGFQIGLLGISGSQYATYYATPVASLLESPNYPSSYPTNYKNCWIVKGKESTDLVTFEVLTMNIEDSNKCEHDYLSVRDGNTATASELARYCGIKSNEKVTSTGQTIYITFNADATGVRSGFQVAYYSKSKSEADSSKKKKSKLALYIGIGVAVVVVIIIIAVLEAKYCMKKKKTKVKPVNITPREAENNYQQGHARIRAIIPAQTVHFTNNPEVAPPAYDDSAPPAYDDINNDSNNGGQRY